MIGGTATFHNLCCGHCKLSTPAPNHSGAWRYQTKRACCIIRTVIRSSIGKTTCPLLIILLLFRWYSWMPESHNKLQLLMRNKCLCRRSRFTMNPVAT
jgi:hypothetical protein